MLVASLPVRFVRRYAVPVWWVIAQCGSYVFSSRSRKAAILAWAVADASAARAADSSAAAARAAWLRASCWCWLASLADRRALMASMIALIAAIVVEMISGQSMW